MRDAVICAPVRTPVGGYGGSLKALAAYELGVAVLRGLIERVRRMPASGVRARLVC
jgi:acetyl-CoA C-acetyltransferase